MDQQEWNRFVDRYYRQIYAFCVQYVGNASEAEDIVQEVFLRAFKKIKTLEKAESERAWLYSIARNYCIDWKRTLMRRLQVKKALAEDFEPSHSIAETGERTQLSRALMSGLKKLPRRQAEVFILRHWHGFSTQETATLLGLQTGSVKSHLKRAVDTLKNELLPLVQESLVENGEVS